MFSFVVFLLYVGPLYAAILAGYLVGKVHGEEAMRIRFLAATYRSRAARDSVHHVG